MAKASMFREPLERYLLIKIGDQAPGLIHNVRVRRLSEPRHGCNWEIEAIEPSLPAEMAADLERKVIAPLRDSIDLAG